MLHELTMLAIAFAVILGACELFSNGVEWLGQRLQLGEGVVGSVLAAVGTALPETIIPIIAVIFFGSRHGAEVGIGAIAGAPFMLSTLTLSLCGLSVWFFSRRGRRPPQLAVNTIVLSRDLQFFITAYSIAILSTFISAVAPLRWLVGAALLFTYGYYLRKTFGHAGEVGVAPEALHFDSLLKAGHQRLILIIPQIVVGLAGIIGGAFIFVDHVQSLSATLGVPALILSFVITPVATEAPEKINSVLWARTGKDTLALGNVTGALVFQSCIPVAFGVALTDWALSPGTIASGVIAIVSAAVYLRLMVTEKLRAIHLMAGAPIYALTVYLLVTAGLAPH